MPNNRDDAEKYDDIINLPHHVSLTHPHMDIAVRAAQFAPFAALSGYEEAVKETARLTDRKAELDETAMALLNGKLLRIRERIKQRPEVTITWFVPDEKKAGGSYFTMTGRVRKMELYERAVYMENGTRIPIDEISEISGV